VSQNKFRLLFTLVIFTGIIGSCLTPFNFVYAAINTNINATVRITICGNNIKETGEDCDGTDLAGKNCLDFGFTGGTLQCLPSCDFDTSNCTTGGGGGGGGGVPSLSPTAVRLSGKAYPLSKVSVLKDGQLAITTIAGPDANFNVSIEGLSAGNYMFAVYGEDDAGRRSSLFTFPIYITPGVTTNISGIFLPPTIDVDKTQVKKGDNINIFGKSTPDSDISIVVQSDQEYSGKIKSDANGIYLYKFDTTPLDFGDHYTKSKAALNGDLTSYSKVVSFAVGTKTVLKTSKITCPKADLNGDCRVNLVDFSVAAYWYKRPLSASFKSLETERLNGDGKVDLVDFSIMAYYWTG